MSHIKINPMVLVQIGREVNFKMPTPCTISTQISLVGTRIQRIGDLIVDMPRGRPHGAMRSSSVFSPYEECFFYLSLNK